MDCNCRVIGVTVCRNWWMRRFRVCGSYQWEVTRKLLVVACYSVSSTSLMWWRRVETPALSGLNSCLTTYVCFLMSITENCAWAGVVLFNWLWLEQNRWSNKTWCISECLEVITKLPVILLLSQPLSGHLLLHVKCLTTVIHLMLSSLLKLVYSDV